jgi:glycosyltransferase involved in cell wall biosynthesis
VTSELRFSRTPDGATWTQTACPYRFWERYLAAFDEVLILARAQEVAGVPDGAARVDGSGVRLGAIPHYVGPRQYLLRALQVGRAVRGALGPDDAVIMRVPSQIAGRLEPRLRRQRRPYGVEVVGDPHDVFAPGVISHPLRPFLRWHLTRRLYRQCADACGASYVTREALQRRYPCPALSAAVSDVELPADAFRSVPRSWTAPLAPQPTSALRLVMVGSLEQLYKAPDVLLQAVAANVRAGLDLSLAIIGDGRYRPQLEAQTAALGIGERAQFLGQLPAGAAVREQLDRSDLFVLASRTEGLPRAMIEAMARALPCIGSTVGGIPELLPGEDRVPPGDADALARKIREVTTDPQRMSAMSSRNLQAAQEYRDDLLQERRSAFYRHVRARTEEWLHDGGHHD